MRMAAKGRRIVQALFEEFRLLAEQLPERYAVRIGRTSCRSARLRLPGRHDRSLMPRTST